jgi:ribosomal-protein-alanine N-acetyltransferase
MLSKTLFYHNLLNILPKKKKKTFSLSSEIYFEKFSLKGLNEMHQYSKKKELYEYFEYKPFKKNDTKNYIKKILLRQKPINGEVTSIYWFIRRQNDSQLIGTANLANINYNRQSAEIGYAVDPQFWGSSFILDIIENLKKYTFLVLKLNKIYGITFVTNKRVQNISKSMGMQFDSISKDFYFKNGVFIDGWRYYLLRKDFLKNEKKIIIKKKNIISKNAIVSIIQNVLNNREINNNSSMENTQKWDSINHLNIILEINKHFKINLSPANVVKATSVEKIYTIISK